MVPRVKQLDMLSGRILERNECFDCTRCTELVIVVELKRNAELRDDIGCLVECRSVGNLPAYGCDFLI